MLTNAGRAGTRDCADVFHRLHGDRTSPVTLQRRLGVFELPVCAGPWIAALENREEQLFADLFD